MTTRIDKITKYSAELRALLGDQDGIEIAAQYGISYEQVDRYDHRIGDSIRNLALSHREKWGTWG